MISFKWATRCVICVIWAHADRRDRWTVKLTDRWTNGWKQMDWRRGGPCYRDVMMHLKRERKKPRIPLHTSPTYRTQTQTRTFPCIRRNISFSILAAATKRSMIYAFTCGPIFPLHCSLPVFSRMHATLHPALSVGWSVSWSHLTFLSILFL